MSRSTLNATTSLAATCSDPGPDLYYYEVVECGRRILLTGVLVYISPSSATQAAMACLFAFGSLLGFELLRPHLDPADSWLYRLVSGDNVFVFPNKPGLSRFGASAHPTSMAFDAGCSVTS